MDVGHPGGKYFLTLTLTYARIRGQEYGTLVSSEADAPSAETQLDVHPNPFRGAVTLDLDAPRPQRASVAVYDVLGRRVLAEAVATPAEHRLDLSALAPGVYVVRATLEDGTALTRRVTKVR